MSMTKEITQKVNSELLIMADTEILRIGQFLAGKSISLSERNTINWESFNFGVTIDPGITFVKNPYRGNSVTIGKSDLRNHSLARVLLPLFDWSHQKSITKLEFFRKKPKAALGYSEIILKALGNPRTQEVWGVAISAEETWLHLDYFVSRNIHTSDLYVVNQPETKLRVEALQQLNALLKTAKPLVITPTSLLHP